MVANVKRLATIWLLAASASAACSTILDKGASQLSVPQSPLLRTVERKSGIIAFSGIDGNIYTMNQAGKDLAQVTNNAELGDNFVRYYGHVTWTQDSKHIAYVSYSGSSRTKVQARLYINEPSGKDAREVFASDRLIPVFLYWAPDSKMLSFLAMQTDGNHGILHLAHIEGGEARVIDTGQPLFWVWTPSATRMLIHSNGSRSVRPDARLAFLSLDNPVVEEGLEYNPTLFQAPAVSPDGRRVLVAAQTDEGDSALIIVDRDGGDPDVLTKTRNQITFDWSPDGRYIGYVYSQSGTYVAQGPLTIVDADPENRRDPMTVSKNVVAFFWSPNGKRVAFFERQFSADLADETPEGILQLSFHVMDIESGESETLFSFTPSEQFAALLPYMDQHQRTFTIWSPDSQYIALSALTESGPAIIVAQADGDFEPRVLHPGTMAVWSWR